MQLNLSRNLVFFDIESTGLNVVRDRIIQIAMIRYHADGRPVEERKYLLNPLIPIPTDASAVHGIKDEDVKDQPTFESKAEEIFSFIGDADLAGYNSNRFDIPILMEELNRAGFDFEIDNRMTIDVQRIFYRMEPRTLSAAYQFYCNQILEQAHDALADVRATVDVLDGQLNHYRGKKVLMDDGIEVENPLKADVEFLYNFTRDSSVLDATQRLKKDNKGSIIFNFGKYTGKEVAEVFRKEPQYYKWMMDSDFSFQVKKIITRIFEKRHEA